MNFISNIKLFLTVLTLVVSLVAEARTHQYASQSEAELLSKSLIQTCKQVTRVNLKLKLSRCLTEGLSEIESVQAVFSQLKRSKFESSERSKNLSNLKKLGEGLNQGRFFVSSQLHEQLSRRHARITKAFQSQNKKALDLEVEQASLVLDQVRIKVIQQIAQSRRGGK